ncbi:MAG TPA: glycine hydroxymethyltransferase, partial [Thermoplasmatales archaeon]|nr:glycine hydroxymethyltransferase [Thermoplasmatales archaeon]
MEEEEIERIVERHEKYRLGGINLIPSENFIMPRVRNLLSSDLVGRYESEWYGGSRYAREICERTVALAKKLFGAKHAIVTPL